MSSRGVARDAGASRLSAAVFVALGIAAAAACAPSFARSPPARIARTDPAPVTAPPDPVGPGSLERRACGDRSECASGEDCFAPDFVPAGGARPECDADEHCSDGMLCDDGRCVARCTPQDCGALERCIDGRCRPRRCDEAGMPDCPRNHRCDRDSGSCARIACQRSDACDEGVCWRGTCYAHGGECHPEAYCCPP